MKTYAIKLLKFLAFFIIVVGTDQDYRSRVESLRFEHPEFDVLAVGASTTFDGIDTELMTKQGIPSYNLALGGTTVKTSYIQLQEYFTSYEHKPELVILGLNSALVNTFDDETIHPIIEFTMKDHKYNLNDIPILKFKWLAFEFLKKVVSSKHRQARLSYGQLKFQKTVPDRTSYQEQYLNLEEFEESYWLSRIAAFCDSQNVRLMVIEMPGYKQTQNISGIGPYTLNLEGDVQAELYNLNSQEFCKIFNSQTDWIGNSHLNEFGAQKFTEELIQILKEQDLIPDGISQHQSGYP